MENEVIIFGLELDRYDLLWFALGAFCIWCAEMLWLFYSCGKSIDRDEQAKLAKDSKSGE